MRRRTFTATCVLVLAVLPAGADEPEDQDRTILPPPRVRVAPGQIRRYREPTERETRRNREIALGWFQAAREKVPGLHPVETRHFLIFSSWPRSDDRRLGETCEKLYGELRRQFALKSSDFVWAGKLPIFIFAKRSEFAYFTADVDGREVPESGGYMSFRSDGFCWVVLNTVHSKTHFFGLLVHETTHAFLARYRTNANVLTWVNEGLAETMSARLVPGCRAATRYVEATREAIRGGREVAGVLDDVGLDEFDYGIAQSLVRYLLARDRMAFIKFVKLLKVGADEATALRHSYGLDRRRLLIDWRIAAAKAVRR